MNSSANHTIEDGVLVGRWPVNQESRFPCLRTIADLRKYLRKFNLRKKGPHFCFRSSDSTILNWEVTMKLSASFCSYVVC